MTEYRSMGEMYLTALECFLSSPNPDETEINSLFKAAEHLQEYTNLHVTTLCDLLGKLKDDLTADDVANIGAVINELNVLSCKAMETRNGLLVRKPMEVTV